MSRQSPRKGAQPKTPRLPASAGRTGLFQPVSKLRVTHLVNSRRLPGLLVACLLAVFASMWFGERPARMDSREANPPVPRSFPGRIARKQITDKVYFGSQTLSDFILPGTVTPLAATAVYDSVLKAPKCGSLDSSCDSGTLLNGRDNISGGAEPNQPNTINNSCADGTVGTYHSDESIDKIKVSTLDASNLGPGKTAKIEVTVWAYTDFAQDHLDLYYATNASNPSWIYITTVTPSAAGAQVLSTTYTLPNSVTLQAVRASFRFVGAPSTCGGGSFDESDDLIFAAWEESTISGRVTNGTGSGLSGRTVSVTSTQGTFTSSPTDSNGDYSVSAPRGVNYTATANGPGESFVRYGTSNSSLQPLSGNVTNFNFAKNTPQYTAAGFVKTIDGFGVDEVTLFPSASGHVDDGPGQCIGTDSTGRFDCFGLWQDTSYDIIPYKENYVFTPASLPVSDNIFPLEFTAHQMATVTTGTANQLGSTTATLNGSVNPHGEATTTARFEWGTDPALASYNETPSQAIVTGTSDQAFSQNLTGLVAGTDYFFRAVGSNSLGEVKGSIVPFTTLPPGTAEYDGALKAPKCGSVYKLCGSGTLLDGRDNISGGAEPNQPNTINDSCADGTSGTYHSDESIDAIKVSTLSGANFAPGKTVKIEVTVWPFDLGPSDDHLDLYYAADASTPTWTYITTLTPSVAGAQVLSTTYDLPNGAGLQAVRARFRYQGTASPCGAGGFDDHDDLIFAVQSAVQFSAATYNKPEDGGTATITVMRTGGSAGAASVQFSNPAGGTATGGASCTAGVDYIAPSGTLNWADGDAADKTFAVTICSDSTVENNETVNLSLSNATGAALGIQTSATLTITNDDTNVSVAVSPSSVAEDGAPNLVYTFTRTGVTTGALTVNFSVGGTAAFSTDYTPTGAASFNASSGTVIIGAGNATATVTVDPSTDSTVESNETAILTVTSGTGYSVANPSAATGTINNDDTDVTVAVSPSSVAEDGVPNLVYTFTRSGVTSNALTVNFSVGGTAAFSTDYTQTGAATFNASSGTVTIGAGNATATVTIDPAVDSTVESNETAILTVTSGTGYNVGSASVATGTITNDDVLRIDTVAQPAGRTSGGQQIVLAGAFAGLSTVTMGGTSASWVYTNGAADTSSITVTTPAHAVGAVQIDLTPTSGSPYSKTNAFAYLPTVFTDNTLVVGQTTAKVQHIIELRQAVDAMRAVAGLSAAPWTDPALAPGGTIKAIHILDLRTYLDDAATRLEYSTSPYTDPSLTTGYSIKRIHIEELRQRIRVIAG